MPSLASRWGLKTPTSLKPPVKRKQCAKPGQRVQARSNQLANRWGLPQPSQPSQPAASSSSRPKPSQPRKRQCQAALEVGDLEATVGLADESEAHHVARHSQPSAKRRCARCRLLC